MFRFNKPSSGRLLLCFAKVIIIKIVKNVVMNQFGCVAAYLSSPYWCVYSAECTESHSGEICSHTTELIHTTFLTNYFNNYNFNKAQQ